jgi:hypothetical protein
VNCFIIIIWVIHESLPIFTALKYVCIPVLFCNYIMGFAVAQAVSRWLPTAAARVRVRPGVCGLWWTKRHWGRFSSSTSVFPANHRSTNFSIVLITRCWHNGPIGGRTVPSGPNWTHPPPLYQYKNSIMDSLLGYHISHRDIIIINELR